MPIASSPTPHLAHTPLLVHAFSQLDSKPFGRGPRPPPASIVARTPGPLDLATVRSFTLARMFSTGAVSTPSRSAPFRWLLLLLFASAAPGSAQTMPELMHEADASGADWQ